MFEPDPERTYIEVKREQVITLLNSTIRPQVAIAGPTEPADAYVCTFKRDNNLYETLIYFTLAQSNKGVVYHWDEGPQPRDNAKSVEREALRFLDEMGFQMDSLHFRKQSSEEQKRLVDTLPCFHPPAPPSEEEMESLEAVAVEEADAGEAMDEIEDISVESLEAEEAAPVEEAGEAQAGVEVEGDEPSIEEETFEAPEEPAAETDAFEEISLEEEPAVEAEPETGTAVEAEEAPPAEEATSAGEGYPQEISLEEDFDEFETASEAVEETSQPEAPREEPAPPTHEAEAAPAPAAEPPPQPAPTSAGKEQKTPPEKPSTPVQKEAGVSKTDMEGVDLEPLARFLASM